MEAFLRAESMVAVRSEAWGGIADALMKLAEMRDVSANISQKHARSHAI